MNPIDLALRRPITLLTLIVGMLGTAGFVLNRMKVDIFPSLNLPVVYVCQPYYGMDPSQMEGHFANFYEYHFLYINGIHHVESRNVQGVALMKLFFHPGTDMAQAMAETVGYVNRSRAFMPPGTVPPFIMRFDTGSVPVGYFVLSSDTKSLGEIQDQALFKVRPMFSSIPGVSAPPPFGGNQRTMVVRVNPDRLRAYNVSADDIVKVLSSGNAMSPSGVIRTPTTMPLVPTNAMVVNPDELGQIRVKDGVFLRDIAPTIEDASDIPTGYALVNGRRAVYILVTKRADASTLDVVNNVRRELPKMRAVLPADIDVSFELDQSPYVTHSIRNVLIESVLAAGLVGLMILLFLRDWRSVLVVVLNIPLALLAAVIGLYFCGHTINLMTLGGLALAVGILVDESTVEVENIHRQMGETPSIAVAVWKGNQVTAIPRLLAMLCILAVFIPALFLQGAARGLFLPLALAVGFSMVASYILSSTLVPVLAVWLLRKRPHHVEPNAAWFTRFPTWMVRLRHLTVPMYMLCTVGLIVLLVRQVGMDVFPRVDAGFFQFRLRAPDGTRIEETEAITRETLAFIGQQVGEENVRLSLGYVGVVPSSYPINSVYMWTGGPEEAVIRVALTPGIIRIDDLQASLREKLPGHLRSWTQSRWLAAGEPADKVESRVQQIRLSFEPADIVNEIMSFGSPTPVEVVVSGPKMADNRAHAAKLYQALARIPQLRDLQYGQSLDYPTVEVKIDREKAALSHVEPEQVAKSLLAATSSSRFVVPNYWRDPASGIGYQVQIEIPQALMRSSTDVELVPIKASSGVPMLVRDIASVSEGTMPGQVDRYNMRRLVSMTANIANADLGTVNREIERAIASIGEPPPGVQVDIRGQVTPMRELFRGLSIGLIIAVVVILLLLTGYFQSLRLGMITMLGVPAVLLGVLLALIATGSTLNLQSFMGAIMAIGVATANSILLITFADRHQRAGMNARAAALAAVLGRLRPILMTSFAMIAGMIPLALGLGEGGDQMAPLGRAVVGGLIASTGSTLLILPAAFVWIMGDRPRTSASISPNDPMSRYFDPNLSTNTGDNDHATI